MSNKSNAGKILDVLANKQAPSHTGKPVFAGDIEICRAAGAKTMADIFGHANVGGNDSPFAKSINFASKSDTSFMSAETRMRLFELKKMISNAEIQAQILRSKGENVSVTDTPIYKNHLEPILKAFNVTDFSTWIPTVNARFYFEEYEIPLLIADLFDTQPMDSSTVTVPGIMGRLFGQLETDVGIFTEQSNTQDGFTVEAKNNVCHSKITQDLMSDSAPSIIEKYRKEVVAGVARSEERTLINGDTTSTHMDSDVTSAKDHRKGYKGLRKIALDNSANGVVYDHANDVPTKALFAALLKRMGRFASDKNDLRWLMPVSVGNDLVTGAIPELFTAYAFGGPASNVTGQVPPVFGIKGVETEYMREDLNASGVYDGTTTDRMALGLVKVSRFQNFMRQPIRVWAAPSLPSSDTMLMSAKKRGSFAGNPQNAEEKSITLGINIKNA